MSESPKKEYGPIRWLLLIGFAIAALLEVLDTSIINPVLPVMAGNLGCTMDEIAWVSTAYILANVIVLPMTAWFSQRLGLGRYVCWSIGIFIVASAACGLAQSFGQIVFWRIVQGAAGASLISMTQAGIAEVFPKKEQTMAIGVWAVCIAVAPSVAPALGGWITDNYAWPFIFFINIPIGAIALLLIMPNYRNHVSKLIGKPDWLGIGLLTVGLGSIQYVLEEGQRKDWLQDKQIAYLTVIGILGTLAFIYWELSHRNKSPIVNLRVLKDRGLLAGTVVSFVSGIGLFACLYLFPVFAQVVLGFTPTKSGMFLIMPGLIMALCMVVGSILMEKLLPARDILIFGLLIAIVSMWMFGHMTPMSNESDALLGLKVRNIGIGLVLVPCSIAAIANLKGDAIGQGSALLGVARQFGGSVGIAISVTYLSRMTWYHRTALADHFYSGNPHVIERGRMYAQALYAKGYSMDAAQKAAAQVMDYQMTMQAYTRAMNNVYILIGILFCLAIPFAFLMKRAKGGGGMGH